MNTIFILFFNLSLFTACTATNFNNVDEIQIPDYEGDDGKEFVGRFLQPNEFHTYVYEKILKNKDGILFSVGTFRALIVFALGNFERLLMVDFKEDTLQYNRNHLNFITELSKKYPNNIDKQMDEYKEKYIFLIFMKGDSEKYYYNDPEKWQKITQALKDNKIHVIRGNLTDECKNKALSDLMLGKFCSIHKTFDISNVPDYIDKSDSLIRVLESFSKEHSKDIILLTSHPSEKIPAKNGVALELIETRDWNYYYSSLENYLMYLKNREDL